ncbi:retrovirus-related pol polyprotein from transposon TNT 1-94 [Tanacetum coccineum]
MSATQTSSQKALTPSLKHSDAVTRKGDAVSTLYIPNLDHLRYMSEILSCFAKAFQRVASFHPGVVIFVAVSMVEFGDRVCLLRIMVGVETRRGACALGKSKKSSNQPKAKDTNQEKLYLLHMDLCGPMRVASFNRKMRVVRFLKTKDEAPEAIIKCIKNVQVHLNATVRNVQTDNGTGFVNQILREFMKMLASRIKHLLPAFLNRTALSKGEIELL